MPKVRSRELAEAWEEYTEEKVDLFWDCDLSEPSSLAVVTITEEEFWYYEAFL